MAVVLLLEFSLNFAQVYNSQIWGFPKGVIVRGGNLNNWAGARTGCNN